ncbi:DUF6930 domain-containing protein [Merismopedia glauca]|uniref:Uncharacterized protein n=1 Tax=Merismopedia glauca CCAP 1448/3 TaxID=1296344 RepID=A0A2T1BZ64_9CYAN|nr:hypothetical protein [Merismopedia glauca]PSB01309.1 hypothetical protein C7B64_18965 [Merismopedia glauca CCAP 1448/3]
MSYLHRSTLRRLQQLPQVPSVWEGDRCPLSALGEISDMEDITSGECIIWIDGVEGIVRAMEFISAQAGPEAIVRSLLHAMENPQSPARPGRPQKVVVRNKEIYFYLRGVLQELGIQVEHSPQLPLIDELIRGFQEIAETSNSQLPPAYAELLQTQSEKIWHLAPWEVLADHQILAIEINRWDVGTVYASVMGMLGMEYGILLYRSLDSLKKFRSSVLAEASLPHMEAAFLEQDCFFLTFESPDDEYDFSSWELEEVSVNFGTIHPLEGMRSCLAAEEALIVYTALSALQKFFQAYREELTEEMLLSLKKTCRITLPKWIIEADFTAHPSHINTSRSSKSLTLAPKIDSASISPPSTVSVKVSTMPELSAELFSMVELAESEEITAEDDVSLQDDLIPEDAFLSLGMISWDNLANLNWEGKPHQFSGVNSAEEGLPVILIQTSRPKAKIIIDRLKLSQGLRGIAFNPGEDPFAGDLYDLGLLQTGDGNLFLFGEFRNTEPDHAIARHKWEQRCHNNQGKCALVIARGLKGSSRGNPQLKDIMAVFAAHSLSSQEIGLGLLQRLPQFDFD